MRQDVLLCLAFLVSIPGCTSVELRDNTVQAAGTLSDLQYQMVMDNLAMLSWDPYLIPWHVKLDSGTVQVSDDLSARLGLSTLHWEAGVQWFEGSATVSPDRQRTQEWDVIPVTKPTELRDLQAAYQKAMGFKPEQHLLEHFDIPTDWFGRGKASDVPSDALYVGHYRDRYVWVTHQGLERLSKLTLIILSIVELKPYERTFSRGIISTPARR